MALTTPLTESDATIVAAGVITGYAKANRIAQLTNQEYTGQVFGRGSSVKIVSLGDVTIADYEPGTTSITPESLSDDAMTLVLDQAKYFSFQVDDTAAAAGAGSWLGAAGTRAGQQMAETIDAHIASVAAAGAGIVYGEPEDNINLSGAGAVYNHLLTLRTAHADTGNARIAVVPSAAVANLLADTRFVGVGSDITFTGEVGRAAGWTIVESNVSFGEMSYGIMTCSDTAAIASAITINKVERYRPESSFSDAVKGLAVFGAKVVRPEAVGMSWVSFAAPSV